MASVFTQIIKGEKPCHKILEDENFLSFLEAKPILPGHTLVIPKQEVDNIFDLDDQTLTGLTLFAKRTAKIIQKAIPCKKVAVMVYGLQVRHAHVHLVPVQGMPGELNFANAKAADDASLAKVAQKIRACI